MFGCGPIGLLAVYLPASAGADVTAVDPVEARLPTAALLGATSFEVTPGGADLAIDAAGFEETWRAAMNASGAAAR